MSLPATASSTLPLCCLLGEDFLTLGATPAGIADLPTIGASTTDAALPARITFGWGLPVSEPKDKGGGDLHLPDSDLTLIDTRASLADLAGGAPILLFIPGATDGDGEEHGWLDVLAVA